MSLPKFDLRRVLLAALLTLSAACSVNAAAPLRLSLVCAPTPLERGLHLDRAGISPDAVTVDGASTDAWVSRHKSVPADEWARSFCLTVTDPRFLSGKLRALDVDVTYMHAANTKVEVVTATQTGSRVIGSGWGTSPGQAPQWQTLHCHLEDADFGNRSYQNDPKTLPVDGFDLRVNAWAGDFHLAKVVLHAHDPANPDDWTPYLSMDSVTDAAKFIVKPGGADALRFTVRNSAAAPLSGLARWETVDENGKTLHTTTHPVTLPAKSATTLPFAFSAQGLTLGEYGVRLTLETGSGEDRMTAPLPQQTVIVAGDRDIFAVFDREPIVRGLDFDRDHFGPTQVTVGGAPRWVWAAGGGSERGADAWWHSVVFKITDDRFRGGKMPAVDLRVTYRHTPDAPVNLFADTSGGSKQVGFGWGRQENWQTLVSQVDDAQFAETDYHDNPKEAKSDGFDLRFNANSGDAQLRSIFIHGYDLDNAPDYGRLLRFDGLDADRDLFIFNPGEKQNFTLKLRNLAHVPLPADYSVRLTDDLGKEMWARNQKATIQGGGPFSLPVAFDTAGLKQGVYTLALSLGRTVTPGKREELIHPEVNVMVSEQSVIPKAKPGEFLYGVDPGVGYGDPRWLQWLDFMGCDITRGNGANENPDDWPAAFAAFDTHHIQNMVFQGIPWDANPAALAQKTRDAAAKAETLARQFGSRAHFWELGNEPDLTFFYPGPMEAYEKGFEAVYKAIKRGNPSAVVMNGGLAYGGGAEAPVRAAQFIALVPHDSIDAFAYHGHGPLVGAERGAYERIHAEAEKQGKADKPFIETESGVSAHTPGQIRVQARTAVEKIVYAQSVGMPLFQWFRLNIEGGDGDYTNTKNVHEARPVVLSYRTMARTLKGMAFVQKLDLGTDEAEAYLFAQKGGERRGLVVWADTRGGGTQTFQIASKPGAATEPMRIDLFGNADPLPTAGSGTVTVPIDLDPSYVTWRDAGPAATVKALPSPLSVAPVVSVSEGRPDTVAVQVKNAGDEPLDATLAAAGGPGSGIALGQPQIAVHVAARSTQTIQVPVTMTASRAAVAWPQRWTVFAPVPTDAVDMTQFKSAVPKQITAKGAAIQPQMARLSGDHLDLSPLGGGFGERKEALLFAQIDSPAKQTIHVGSSADWWEQWFVNGIAVYDDLATGNAGGQSVLEHQFDMPLQAGRNLIAARVLSGSEGWKVFTGGPQEVAARGASTGEGSALTLELRQNGTVLARARTTVALRHPLAPLGSLAWDGPVAAWESSEADGDFTEVGVVNEWAKQPDATRWWHGPEDLSGSLWLRADEQFVYVIAAVKDDVFHPAPDAAGIDSGDSLRVALAGPDGNALQIGIPAGGGAFRRDASPDGKSVWTALPAGDAAVKIARVGETNTTWYRLRLTRRLLPSDKLAVNALVNDDDFGGHKQSDAWFPGMDAAPAPIGQWWQGQLK